jgi:molecular chaperone HscA
VEVKPSYGLSETEITTMLKASFDHAEADVEMRAITEAKVDAGRVKDAVQNALAKDGERLLEPEEREVIADKILAIEAAIASGSSAEIMDATETLAKATDEFAARRMDDSVRSALSGKSLDEVDT